MIITGKIDRILKATEHSIASFILPNYQATWLEELEKDETYKIEISKVKSKKSLQQNNYAWALMSEIAKKNNLIPNADHVYMQILKMAKIKTNFIMALDEDEVVRSLKKAFRVVIKVDEREYNGRDMAVYECCYGMSTFDKEEMSRFIDVLLEYASKVGVDVGDYSW